MSSLLQKLAEQIETAQKGFSNENERLKALPAALPGILKPEGGRTELAQGIWVDFKPDSGVKTQLSGKGGSLRIQTASRGESPWFSFSYRLSVSKLKGARFFGQLVCCSSQGSARFNLCLRIIFADGFRDVFCDQIVVMTGEEQQEFLVIRLDQELLADAVGAEVLFFFEGHAFDVTLNEIEALHI